MSAQHSSTPGPWRIDFDGRTIAARAFGGSEKWIVDRVRGGSPEEADANTRLIAAAPDLLSACKMVASFAVAGEPLSVGDIQEVLNAIAKAEGR